MTGWVKRVLIGRDVSMLNVGNATLIGGGGTGVGVALGVGVGEGVRVGDGVGTGLGVPVGPGVGVGPVIVMRPLFWTGENAFRSVSINSKSFGKGDQLSGVFCPAVVLTLTKRVLKRTPDPLSGVTPSFEKADTRNVFNVPGPVFRTFEPTVHPLVV